MKQGTCVNGTRQRRHSGLPAGSAPTPGKVHAVDLFCGIGGLTHGLRSSGMTVSAGYDIDPSCRYAYEANNESTFVEADIRDVRFGDIESHYANAAVSVLAGCAPCQPFSAHTRGSERSDEDCSLLLEFARIVAEGRPEIISIENVPGLARHQAFAKFTDALDSLGYHIDYGVLSCEDYGVPQTRRRLVLLASLLGEISLPTPTKKRPTVADFITGQPSIGAGETHPNDRAHASIPLSPRNLRRIRQSKPGGSWKDWDEDLVNPCHTATYYPASYGRMRWDALAPTITTQFCYYSTGRFGHPEQDRAISVREGALLQTFPADYDLIEGDEPFLICNLARHIGNAVPVKLAAAIGQRIMEAAHVE